MIEIQNKRLQDRLGFEIKTYERDGVWYSRPISTDLVLSAEFAPSKEVAELKAKISIIKTDLARSVIPSLLIEKTVYRFIFANYPLRSILGKKPQHLTEVLPPSLIKPFCDRPTDEVIKVRGKSFQAKKETIGSLLLVSLL